MNAPKRQPRSVTATYGAVSATLLVVIATVALIVKPPSPPALAEFAPQAENTIEETADNQSSRFGSGGNGSCSAGQLGCEGIGVTTTTALEAEADRRPDRIVPRKPGTRCVGDPPRQIDDHQSPPCADPWEGDNGGATAKGVTATEIRVAHWSAGKDHIEGLVQWFNTKFEFYGRSIRLVKPKLGAMGTPEQQRAAADSAAELQPFAAIQFTPYEGMLAYRQRLADHRVVSVAANDDFSSERDLTALHPYAWNYSLSYDKLATDLGEFACKALAGRTARNAGPELAGEVRSFGVVTGDYNWGNPPRITPMTGDIGPAVDLLKRCNAPVTVRNVLFGGGNEGRLAPIMADFKKDKVTTVIVAGPLLSATTQSLTAAQNAGYEPEWLIPGGGGWDHLTEAQYAVPAGQAARLLTLNGTNKNLPKADWPSTWAYDEAGVQVPTEDRHWLQNYPYQGLLLLASGIQQAGPRLTPETFARGLQATRFPNPGAGAAPFYQASVGFTGDHTMIDDEAVQWWSAAAPARWGSTAGSPGGWCNFRQGARWRRGAWPDGPLALFDASQPCH